MECKSNYYCEVEVVDDQANRCCLQHSLLQRIPPTLKDSSMHPIVCVCQSTCMINCALSSNWILLHLKMWL